MRDDAARAGHGAAKRGPLAGPAAQVPAPGHPIPLRASLLLPSVASRALRRLPQMAELLRAPPARNVFNREKESAWFCVAAATLRSVASQLRNAVTSAALNSVGWRLSLCKMKQRIQNQ